MQLRWSDVWLLLAVYAAWRLRGRSFLSDVVAEADHIDHAMINFEELSSGMARLSDRGLIVVDSEQWTVECTEKALSLIKTLWWSGLGRLTMSETH